MTPLFFVLSLVNTPAPPINGWTALYVLAGAIAGQLPAFVKWLMARTSARDAEEAASEKTWIERFIGISKTANAINTRISSRLDDLEKGQREILEILRRNARLA